MEVFVSLSGCAGRTEVWVRLLAALGAPAWHGQGLDALWDGLTGELFPRPAAVVVSGRGDAAAEAEWGRIAGLLAEAGVAPRRGAG